MTIGQFAAASGLTRRALRIYDTEGVLRPAKVDPTNGYRYYAGSQLRQADLVRSARALNMPLLEIQGLLADDPPQAHERLDRFWDQVSEKFRTARTNLGKLHQVIDQNMERSTGMSSFEEANRSYFIERDYEKALELYQSVEESDPNYALARRYIGHNIYGREWSRWEEGLPFLEEALAAAPNDPKVLEDVGRAYVAVGKIEEGKRYLERAHTPVAERALRKLA